MCILILIVASAVLLFENAACQSDNAIKRGTFPFMAFVYYPDQIVDDSIGAKFTRSAVLIRQDWLITSSMEREDTPIAFPEKTLIARLGAISIDAKFNLYEDEDEQEREIIRIARPYNFNNTEWWYTDISLLKTLFPFNITSTVAIFTTRSTKLNPNENCFILAYIKRSQNATESILMKMTVELQPSSSDNCGSYFSNDTMVCAVPNDEKSDFYLNSDICLANSGGPLICGSELTAIQTYINNCKPPYLYQLLNSWDDLISCATEEKCQEEQCAKICFTLNKDPPTVTTPKMLSTEVAKVKLADGYDNETNVGIFITPTVTTVQETKEISIAETEKTTLTTIKEVEITTKTTVTTSTTTDMFEDTSSEPNDKTDIEATDFPEERERKTNVEAQQHRLHSGAPIATAYPFNYLIYFYVVMRHT